MNSLNRLFFYVKKLGLIKTSKFIASKFITIKVNQYQKCLDLFENKSGIEIGGPSGIFNSNNILPIYSVIKNLDGVNFSTFTIWEGNLSEGTTFRYDNNSKQGYQYIADAVDLNLIQDAKYDFLLSCNNLEHIANPLKAVSEWIRVIKTGGILLLVLPNNKINFDHKRSITTLEHLINDYNNNVTEHDLSSFDEILKLHDLFLDPKAGTLKDFKERALQNFDNRALHHHVYDVKLLEQIYRHFNMEILFTTSTITDHYIIGRKR